MNLTERTSMTMHSRKGKKVNKNGNSSFPTRGFGISLALFNAFTGAYRVSEFKASIPFR